MEIKFRRLIQFYLILLISLTVNFTDFISHRHRLLSQTRPGLDPKYIHVHKDGRLNSEIQNPSFKNHTRLFVDELMKGNVSMKIFKVKLSDAGKYFCFLPSMQKEASVQLTVRPVKVTATVGQDVTLPCHLQPPFDVSALIVEWRHDGKVVHRYRNGVDYLRDQDKNYKDRTSLSHKEMTEGNLSLKLSKVTKLDEGSYTCNVEEDKKGSVTLIVAVSVHDGDKRLHTNNTGPVEEADGTGLSDGAIAGAAIAGILVLAVIIFFVWKKCRNPGENAGGGGGGQDDML